METLRIPADSVEIGQHHMNFFPVIDSDHFTR
jgi:hypothetical protein